MLVLTKTLHPDKSPCLANPTYCDTYNNIRLTLLHTEASGIISALPLFLGRPPYCTAHSALVLSFIGQKAVVGVKCGCGCWSWLALCIYSYSWLCIVEEVKSSLQSPP